MRRGAPVGDGAVEDGIGRTGRWRDPAGAPWVGRDGCGALPTDSRPDGEHETVKDSTTVIEHQDSRPRRRRPKRGGAWKGAGMTT